MDNRRSTVAGVYTLVWVGGVEWGLEFELGATEYKTHLTTNRNSVNIIFYSTDKRRKVDVSKYKTTFWHSFAFIKENYGYCKFLERVL